jgi:predicted DNA-binding transcriptional regulator AlpA
MSLPPTESPFVELKDVAKYFQVSESTIISWRKQNRIPRQLYIHVGKTYRYDLGGIVKVFTEDLGGVIEEPFEDTAYEEDWPEEGTAEREHLKTRMAEKLLGGLNTPVEDEDF